MFRKFMKWFKNYELRVELVEANQSRCWDIRRLTEEELNALLG